MSTAPSVGQLGRLARGRGMLSAHSTAQVLLGAGVEGFSATNKIQSATNALVDFAPGRSLALIYFSFAVVANSPGTIAEVVVACFAGTLGGAGWSLVNQYNGIYLYSGAHTSPTLIGTGPFALGLHRLVLVWRASDSHLLVSHNGGSLTDLGLLTYGGAPSSSCYTTIGGKPVTYSALVSGSVCAWAVIGSEVSNSSAVALSTIPTTTSAFSFSGTWLETPAGGSALLDFDAYRDWQNGSASSITTLGSAPVTMAVSGSPTWRDLSERRVPISAANVHDGNLVVAAKSGWDLYAAFSRVKLTGTYGRAIGFEWSADFAAGAAQGGVGCYAGGSYVGQVQDISGSGVDYFVNPSPGTSQSQTVELWNGNEINASALVGPVTGTTITAVRVPASGGVSIVAPSPPTKRLLLVCDSIFSFYAPPFSLGVAARLRSTFPGGVTQYGWGGMSLHQIGADASSRATAAALIASMLDGTVANYVWIQLSTNDYGGGSWGSAAAFGAGYGDFLDQIHARAPSALIWCQTAFPRVSPASENDNGAGALSAYRTQITSAAAARAAYCTAIDGTAIYANTLIYDASTQPTGRYYSDGLHEDVAGNATGDIAAAQRTAIGW